MRLIDADKLVKIMQKQILISNDDMEVGFNWGIDHAIILVSSSSTVDAVPVVRCKDCKYFEDCETYCLCTNPEKGWHTKEDNYCESGERK